MLILGLDFETTGLSADTDAITEVGAVLWDWEAKAPVLIYQKFIDSGHVLSKKIVDLTGITQEMLSTYGVGELEVCTELGELVRRADYFCAHNAPFDKAFYTKLCERSAFLPSDKVWIDTSVDVNYPDKIETRKLTFLAAEHGFVNPFAHRAVTDVLTMLQVLSKYDIEEVILNAKSPHVTIMANTTYEQRELPKSCGFRWNGDMKAWIKSLKQVNLEKEIDKCMRAGFTVRELKNVK